MPDPNDSTQNGWLIAALIGGAILFWPYLSDSTPGPGPGPGPTTADMLDRADDQYRDGLADIFDRLKGEPKTPAVKQGVITSIETLRDQTHGELPRVLFGAWYEDQDVGSMLRNRRVERREDDGG